MVIDPQRMAALASRMGASEAQRLADSLTRAPDQYGYFKVIDGTRTTIMQGGHVVLAIEECPACHGNCEVQVNDSLNGDPQCDDYARCLNCDEGLVLS